MVKVGVSLNQTLSPGLQSNNSKMASDIKRNPHLLQQPSSARRGFLVTMNSRQRHVLSLGIEKPTGETGWIPIKHTTEQALVEAFQRQPLRLTTVWLITGLHLRQAARQLAEVCPADHVARCTAHTTLHTHTTLINATCGLSQCLINCLCWCSYRCSRDCDPVFRPTSHIS